MAPVYLVRLARPPPEEKKSPSLVLCSRQNVLGMKEQAGLLKILGPLVGEANRLYGYDRDGVSIALNPVDARIDKVEDPCLRRLATEEDSGSRVPPTRPIRSRPDSDRLAFLRMRSPPILVRVSSF